MEKHNLSIASLIETLSSISWPLILEFKPQSMTSAWDSFKPTYSPTKKPHTKLSWFTSTTKKEFQIKPLKSHQLELSQTWQHYSHPNYKDYHRITPVFQEVPKANSIVRWSVIKKTVEFWSAKMSLSQERKRLIHRIQILFKAKGKKKIRGIKENKC